jgi:hypothetical protein
MAAGTLRQAAERQREGGKPGISSIFGRSKMVPKGYEAVASGVPMACL